MKFPLKNLKINKTWIVVGAALTMGLLAALVARNYLSNEMAAIESRRKGEMVNVVVAKGKMKKGDVISSATVAVRSVLLEYAHSNALMPNQFDTFDGKVLAYGANSGEMILWGMLEAKKTPTFSARVEAGRRAITVPVDEINSISGLLEPGDLIDLIVTVSQRDKKFTFPLLQSVRVMATGQRSADDPKSGERRQYSTVTLDATPKQAQNVIVAREAGKITALLRNPNDKQEFRGGNNDLSDMLGPKADASLRPLEQALGIRQVPVLYGGRSAKLPPEGLQMGKYVHAAAGQLPVPNLGTIAAPAMPADSVTETPTNSTPPAPVKGLTAPSVRQP